MGWVNKNTQSFANPGKTLASIDPGPTIGKAFADVDKFVGDVIPGGWAMVGAIAITIATWGAVDLEEFALPAAAVEEGAAAGTGAAASIPAGGGAFTAAAGSGASFAVPQTALQAALSAAQTGALYGGGIGGVNAAIHGQDPLKGALMGALYGGLTGGALSGLDSLGVNSYLAKALTTIGTGVAQGQDITTLLQNTALNTGLSALGNNVVPNDINPAITAAGTGAVKAAITGRDPITGAVMGAGNSLLGQGLSAGKDYAKELYGNLTAPSADATINPATGQPISQGSGLTGNGGLVNLAGVGDMSPELLGKYLTEASAPLSSKVAELMPTIAEQKAALLDQAKTVETNNNAVAEAKTALASMVDGQYATMYKDVLALQTNAKDLESQANTLQTIYDTNKKAYEDSQGADSEAFKAANDAAAQLTALIPQLNTTIETFKTADTQLEKFAETNVKPLVEAFKTAQTTLNDSVNKFSTGETQLGKVVDTAASYLTGLNDISNGKLPTDYKAAELSLSAPTAQGFTNEELAAIQQGQQDAVAAAGTGSQTASTDNIGYVPPSTDVNYTGDKVEVKAPEGDLTDAQPIPFEPVPEDPDQALLDQIIANQQDNQQGPTGGNNGGTQPVTEQPVTEQPVTEQPVTEQPVTEQPVTEQPVTEQPVTEQPVTEQPVTEQPVTEQPVTEQPVTEQPVTEQPVTEQPVTEQPVTPPVEQPVTPPVEQPVTEQPVTEQPVTPPVEQPVTPPVPSPIGSVTNPDGSVTTYYDTGESKVTVPPTTTEPTTPPTTTEPTTPPTTTEPTTPPTTGGGGTTATTTGGGTSTGAGVTAGLTMAQITALINAAKGTVPAAVKAAPVASTFADLTPGLTKGSAFHFASEPKFTEQVTPVSQQNMPDYTSQILNAATGGSTNDANTFADLKPGLARGSAFSFAHKPSFEQIRAGQQQQQQNPVDYTQQILNAAQGGLVYNFAEGGQTPEEPAPPSPTLRPGFIHGSAFRPMSHRFGAQFAGYHPQQFADGGDVEQEHVPQFYSEGGLNSLDNTYVKGEGDGTSDSVPAMLANGEFVIPADVVSKLGNGSNDAGADVLGEFLATIREHAQNHDPKKLPPESKGALAYLLDAKRKVG